VIRVLLVDDHQLLRDSLRALLDAEPDVSVTGTASDGDEAVECVEAVQPDVVLMDLSMPRMGGVEATRRLLARYPSAQVVVLTSFPDQQLIFDSIQAGAVGYLLKDAAPDEVLRAVRSAAAGQSPLDGRVARTLLTRQSQGQASSSALTEREREVLRLVAQGLANKQIARRLGIAERTVKAHLTSAFQRIGAADRTQAALWVARHNL
jgi:DNA-binding NarL/FixJ family response regulator